MAEFTKLPENPTNGDLAGGLAELHTCLNKLVTDVEPIVISYQNYKLWRGRIVGAIGALALAVTGSAASGIYNSLTLNSHSASMATAADQNRVNEQLLVSLQQMQAQQAQRSADSATNRAKQNALLTQMMDQIHRTAPRHK